MAEGDGVGTGRDGLVIPGDLDDPLVDEASALGNGEDAVVDETAAPGNGVEPREAAPASRGNGEDRDWTEIDRHSDQVIAFLEKIWEDSEKKAQETLRPLLDRVELNLGKLVKLTETNAGVQFRDMKLFITSSVGAAGREQAAAAWRGPAEALRLLGSVLVGLSQRAGQDAIGNEELTNMFPVLKTAEALLLRACQHEEGRLPVIDEALGGTGTHGARTAVVAASVSEAVALVEKMMRGSETPGRKAVAVLVAGSIVQLGGVFGAEGENSEFVRRVERLRQERAGPVEGAESNDVRAFRADFGKELERLRNAMRWRERGIWAAGLACSLLLGWGVGVSGADFSFVGRLL